MGPIKLPDFFFLGGGGGRHRPTADPTTKPARAEDTELYSPLPGLRPASRVSIRYCRDVM
jgi:hypothetical protein